MLSLKRSFLPQQEKGFTIIELLIATGVFSVVMLVITAGVIGFTRQYYKGVVTSNTQTTARSIMSEITQGIQFGKSVTLDLYDPSTETYGFCIDDKLYSYKIGQQVNDAGINAATHQAYHALVVDNAVTSCETTTPIVPGTAALTAGEQREMLGDKMRLTSLDITTEDNTTFVIHLRILYGDDDVLSPDPAGIPTSDWPGESCSLDRSSLQYCAVTDLTTKVQKRIQ